MDNPYARWKETANQVLVSNNCREIGLPLKTLAVKRERDPNTLTNRKLSRLDKERQADRTLRRALVRGLSAQLLNACTLFTGQDTDLLDAAHR